MINPDAEVAKLRNYLDNRGWFPQEIDEICDLASRDINDVILDVVSNAVAEATEHAEEFGANEFLEDLDVVEMGGGFIITTRSGKTDFSRPAKQMRDDLLKNAEVGEDGDRYKVIPVGGKKSINQPKDIFSLMRQRQTEQQEARASLLENNMDKRSARAQQMAGHFRSIIARRLQESRSARKPRTSQQVTFRTVSDKQDAETQWVIPAVNMDMTGYLMDMNRRIDETISGSIAFIIESYEKEFA